MRSVTRARWAVLALAMALAIGGCQGTVASPSPSVAPDPTPTPPPPSEEEVVRSFLLVAANSALTMHVVADGKVTVTAAGTTEDVKIGFDMDISGQDGHGKAVVDTGPSNLTFDMLLVDGHAYLDDNGTWTEVPDFHASTPLNPFFGLTSPDELTYRGHEIRDGRRVHHMSVLPWLGGDVSLLEAQGWSRVKVDYTLTTLTVEDNGAPIELNFSGGISGRYQDLGASAAFEVTYAFSKVGAPVDIPTPNLPAST